MASAAHHRQVHAGVLAVEVDPRGCVQVTTVAGRVRVGPPHPERQRAVTHVGNAQSAAAISDYAACAP